MTATLILGLVINAIALPIAGKRIWFLYRLIANGQPAPDRIAGVTQRLGAAIKLLPNIRLLCHSIRGRTQPAKASSG